MGTSFGWDNAPHCHPSPHTNDVFGKHVTTAFTGPTRIIGSHFVSEIAPKITF